MLRSILFAGQKGQDILNYRSEIDGLRAVAVLPVVLYHAGVETLSGGFLGVDVFFVISGFLITAIIMSEIDAGNFSILRFYERRARRILPAFTVMIALVGLYGWFFFTPEQMQAYGRSAAASVAFLSNFNFWFDLQDYFSRSAEEMALLHTWSLSIEEQFYLFFPVLLLLVHRWLSVTKIIFGLSLISFVWAQYSSVHHPFANFFLLPSRIWELSVGAWLALVPIRVSDKAREWLSAAGLTGIVGSFFLIDDTMHLPGWQSLFSVLGTGLILSCAQGTRTSRILSWGPLVWIGLISYSLYLWHNPVLTIFRGPTPFSDGPMIMATGCFISLVLAVLSYRYVEQPFRKGGLALGQRAIFSAALASIFIIGLAGSTIWLFKGVPERLAGKANAIPIGFEMPSRANGYCFYDFNKLSNLPVTQEQSCHLGSSVLGARKALLFGDSHAGHYEPFWDDVGKDIGLSVTAVTTNWCHSTLSTDFRGNAEHPSRPQCQLARAWVEEHAEEYDVVIVASTWGPLVREGRIHEVTDFLDWLNVRSIPVIIMPPAYNHDRRSVDRYFLDFSNVLPPGKLDAEQAEAFRIIGRYADTHHDRAYAISRDMLFNRPGKHGVLTDDRAPYTLDGSHLSVYGARAAAANFKRHGGEAGLLNFIKAN